MKLSVILPVYNEKNTIQEVIQKVMSVDVEKELIIVDDCSNDGTKELLKKFEGQEQIRILYHQENQGKGSAIRTALKHVTGDVVIIQDADLELDPQDYPELLKPILEGKTEVVYGSRYLKETNTLPPFRFRIAVHVLNFMVRILFGVKITDEATCYKLIKTELLKSIPLKCKRFEFCPEVTAKILKRKQKIVEVPISYNYRTVKQGKKIGFMDGLEAMWTLLKYRFKD